jgi:IS6 family transposase
MKRRSFCSPIPMTPRSVFAGHRFPPEVIVLAVRWYLRYVLSYRDLEELLAEHGIETSIETSLPARAKVSSDKAMAPR